MVTKIKKFYKIMLIYCLAQPIVVSSKALAANAACVAGDANACLKDAKVSPIMDIFKTIVTILSGAVILLATIMIIVAGITYITSNGDSNKVASAKKMISNIVLGLVVYFFLWVFLQWLIPGGVFG